MNIVALYKTFRGEEFLEASIRSIYDRVHKIVLVNSEISWTGRKGNTCKEVIKKFVDTENKLISIDCDTSNQLEQCDIGFQYIKYHFDCDFVMLIDTDEVWDNKNLDSAIKCLEDDPRHDVVYRVGIYTYIKSPYYRVTPIEPLKPVVFVSTKRNYLGSSQRCHGLESVTMQTKDKLSIFYHHFVYVRKDFNTVLEKIISSHVSENREYQDMSEWIPQVWNRLPRLQGKWKDGFHPAIGFQGHWSKLEKVELKSLPEVFTQFPHLLLDCLNE